jgi:hypothetical protein
MNDEDEAGARSRSSRLGLVLPLVAFALIVAGYVVTLVIELR